VGCAIVDEGDAVACANGAIELQFGGTGIAVCVCSARLGHIQLFVVTLVIE